MSYKGPRSFREIVDLIARDLKARNKRHSKKFITDVIHEFFNKGSFAHLFNDGKPVHIKGLGKFVKKKHVQTLPPNDLTKQFEQKVAEITTQQRRNNYAKAMIMSKVAIDKKKKAKLAKIEREKRIRQQIEEDKKLNNSYFFY